jgi:molybdate transport system ATP-binding protein
MDETELPRVRDVFGDDLTLLDKFTFSNNFDIHSLLDLPVTRLSNGQLKKVIMLRQLAKNIPKILILDYPFDGLDSDSRADLSHFIDDLATQLKIQIVLVDHGDTFPSVMNRRLTLRDFKIEKIEDLVGTKVAATKIYHNTPAATNQNSEPVVEMQNLTIQYGHKKILSDINWRINRGERWALTGRNGSGKTTLFSLIYADHPMAYSQKVFLFGKRRGTGESIWDIKKRINYFGPEQIHFLNTGSITFTARQYIGTNLHKRPERLTHLVEFFRADKYIDKPLRYLSSGQLQMVLLMNMFLDDKELLLLDEPFQFIDPKNHERVTEYLNEYLDENITLVLITHDERDVRQWTQLRKAL